MQDLHNQKNFVKNDKSVDGDLTGFCNKINSSNYCAGLDASTGEEYKVAPDTVTEREEDTGDGDFVDQEYTITYCRHYAKSPEGGGASGSGDAVQLERPKVTDTCKPAHGYYGMYNSGGDYALSCECISGKLPTQNNDKVCCPQLTGLNSYSRSDITSSMSEGTYCVNCEGDFNSVGNWCCPAHSVFNLVPSMFSLQSDSVKLSEPRCSVLVHPALVQSGSNIVGKLCREIPEKLCETATELEEWFPTELGRVGFMHD